MDIIVEKKSAAELENAIRDSTLATIKGDPTGLVVFHFDVKQSGEPLTRPELRTAPLRDANYHRLVRTVLNARAPAGATAGLRSGEVAILLDGGRKGNINKLLAPWREGTSKDKRKHDDDDEDDDDKEDDPDDSDGTDRLGFTASVINIIYSEDSIARRRKKLRCTTGGIQQSEWAHMLAHSKICLPERVRKHYAGTTSGDTIMGVDAADPDKDWTMSWADKKALYGKKNLIAVGGKTKGAHPDDVVERKTDSTQVPVTHHGMPPRVVRRDHPHVLLQGHRGLDAVGRQVRLAGGAQPCGVRRHRVHRGSQDDDLREARRADEERDVPDGLQALQRPVREGGRAHHDAAPCATAELPAPPPAQGRGSSG